MNHGNGGGAGAGLGRERPAGRVTLRRDAIRADTADQGLLDSKGRADWKTKDAWRALRILSEFVEGFDTLADLPPAVSVFGSARSKPDSVECQIAEELGAALARAGYAVITGGGPGVMEAANRGAREGGGFSAGFNIELPHEQQLNPYVDFGVTFQHFYARKTMLVKAAEGFVLFPGGFGTLDEMFESLTLIQTGKVLNFPVVLVGRDFWEELIEWLHSELLTAGTIAATDERLLYLTDDPEEAVKTVVECYREHCAEAAAESVEEEAERAAG